ncbi:hypothetical protein [Mesorhizobium sp.]|nr:hypothetical protein [Mesorhizobium sp.]
MPIPQGPSDTRRAEVVDIDTEHGVIAISTVRHTKVSNGFIRRTEVRSIG